MKIQDIYILLDKISPFELQEKWDNSGINIGSYDDEVKHIVLSLDVDTTLVEKLENNTLLITHHPLIFSPLTQIDKSFPSALIREMIKKDISLIATHTNFDKTHLNKYVLEEVLNFQRTKKDGFIAYANTDMTFTSLVKYVGEKLNLQYTKTIGEDKHIKTIALITGSGASVMRQIRADCFLSGDIKYHDAMMALELGLNIIDIGHYESEIYFATILQDVLAKQDIPTQIINSSLPFCYKKI